ncbi:ABC transporter ATP-binding protein [Agromyces aerolatus]|uniref:ABC transporter ATP-binding protein n=1 Tax=Agromyces sp. LY-1074 TaxID=3074080 RepID=UPI00286191EA|nr:MULTISPECIES: ABC transporter ATP-binding protein [unclassified Agromyces]MDR5699406.1 ABC transporter ATP-binding protein [Agromyces sp. LY-1074]MDR5705702.1 ABC transporter ATP-binding protein [Agromyces sp. LY-1358]
MITAEGVQLAFGDAEVLRDVALRARDGEVVGLIGPNGSGKTTLLRTLYRALAPDAGSVQIDGRSIRGLRPRDVARAVAVVVQEAHHELPLTVSEIVMLGRTPHLGTIRRQSAGDVHVAAEALRRVGADHLAGREFGGLSGGEKQRVLIARALAQDATHLLLDEPTNHLDIHFQHEMLDLVRSLGVCTIVVLHDLNLAARYCDRLLLLHRGRVAAAGATEDVLDPRVLEPVYGIHIEPVRAGDGRLQLLFRAPTHAHAPDHEHERALPPDLFPVHEESHAERR